MKKYHHRRRGLSPGKVENRIYGGTAAGNGGGLEARARRPAGWVFGDGIKSHSGPRWCPENAHTHGNPKQLSPSPTPVPSPHAESP